MTDDIRTECIQSIANGVVLGIDLITVSGSLADRRDAIVELLLYLASGHPDGTDTCLRLMAEHPKRAAFEAGHAAARTRYELALAEKGAAEARAKGTIS